jgi:Ca2+-binding EF-hand superfamily protein
MVLAGDFQGTGFPRKGRGMGMKNKNTTPSLWIAGALALAAAAPVFAGNHNDEFSTMDADRDGKVSQAEHLAFSRSLFAQSDANGDAHVTPSEWDAAAVAASPGVKMDPADTAAQLFAMDSDGDGKVSSAESDAYAASVFTRADKNGDGALTQSEYKAAQKEKEKAKK